MPTIATTTPSAIDGNAEVLDKPAQETEDGLAEYFRCISREHQDYECREAMRRQAD
jgi:hypothetical protein